MRNARSNWVVAAVALAGLTAVAGCGHETESRAAADASEVEALSKLFAMGDSAGDETPAAAATFQHSGGFQTIAGRIRYDGTPPARRSLMDQILGYDDRAVCAPGGVEVLEEKLLVHAQTKGIANVVLYLKSEKNREIPIHESARSSRGPSPSVDNKNCLFVPHVVAVHVDVGSIPMRNLDSVRHNMQMNAQANVAQNTIIPPNASSSYQLTKAEPMPFKMSCSIHPWMRGYMHVQGNGYFAVTDDNGDFKIENLPTGDKLTIQVWHEAGSRGDTGGTLSGLSVGGGEAQPVRGGFTITLDADNPPAELDIAVPPTSLPGA